MFVSRATPFATQMVASPRSTARVAFNARGMTSPGTQLHLLTLRSSPRLEVLYIYLSIYLYFPIFRYDLLTSLIATLPEAKLVPTMALILEAHPAAVNASRAGSPSSLLHFTMRECSVPRVRMPLLMCCTFIVDI